MALPLLYSLCAGLLVTAIATPAAAQFGPAGQNGGLFGGARGRDPRTTQSIWTVNLTAGAGYDKNVLPAEFEDVPPEVLGWQQSSAMGTFIAATTYGWGNVRQSVQASGRGYASYAAEGIEKLWSVEGNVRGTVERERYGFDGSYFSRYEPQYLFTAFGPINELATEPTLPGTVPQHAIVDERWISQGVNVDGRWNWTRRQATHFTAGSQRRSPVRSEVGAGLDATSMNAGVSHGFQVGRTLTFTTGYQYNETTQETQLGGNSELRTHTARAGISVSKPLSPSRTLTYSLTAGAALAQADDARPAEAVDFVTPTLSGTVSVSLTRSWTLIGYAGRDVNVLQGMSPEPFAAYAGSVSLTGNLSRRVQAGFNTSYSQGRSALGNTGQYHNLTGQGGLQFALSRSTAIFGGYSYYGFHVSDVPIVPVAFPREYQRHSVRVAFNCWLPLHGAY